MNNTKYVNQYIRSFDLDVYKTASTNKIFIKGRVTLNFSFLLCTIIGPVVNMHA